jgi:hypothetical protein
MLLATYAYSSGRVAWVAAPAGGNKRVEIANSSSTNDGVSMSMWDGSLPIATTLPAPSSTGTPQAGNDDVGATHILALYPQVTSLAIAKPAALVTGDVMIASIAVRDSGAVVTPPAGWTALPRVDQTTSGNTMSLLTYWRAAAAGEPATYTWTLSGTDHAAGGIQAFSGVDTAAPINASAGQQTA